jgi:hypothetical protein
MIVTIYSPGLSHGVYGVPSEHIYGVSSLGRMNKPASTKKQS